ncbi:DsbA family protein [Maricaulis sp.]|uniref:DsbA family protein n=1 Tax=Maricaulis sp. TaxID=1486257 RepID=UPI001B0A4104|nr:DsbA family protein [Maricaulis sp.]MBO6798306.1 DsbA family protein [Maricaulis sp.]
MTRVIALLAAAAFLLGCQQAPADAQLTEPERDEVRELVREYILSNPEIIEEALIELQRRARDREMRSFYTAIEANHDAIYGDPRDARIGPDDADIIIVEFVDYKCSYCRIAAEWLDSATERYGDRVQIIFKEYPVLGSDSIEAARAALAALRQGEDVYRAFHHEMITASGPLPSRRIDSLAQMAGVDVAQMREDMQDPALMAQIGEVRTLGQVMGVTGTPFFIVDGRVIPGANELGLEQALQAALAG